MKKRLAIFAILVIVLGGCSSEVETIDSIGEKLATRFELVKKVPTDDLIGKDGYYQSKVILNSRDDKEIINIEQFDNQEDLDNRLKYLDFIYKALQDEVYIDNIADSGGLDNRKALVEVFGTSYDEYKLIPFGNLIVRVFGEDIPTIEDYLTSELSPKSLKFKNQKKGLAYDVDKIIGDRKADGVTQFYEFSDELFEGMINIHRDEGFLTSYLELSTTDFIELYESIINDTPYNKIPYYNNKFLNDPAYTELIAAYENSLDKVETERLEKLEEERVAKLEKEKQEIADKLQKESESLNEFVIMIESAYVKNYSPDSTFSVEVDNESEMILIKQTFNSDDLKLAMSLNLVYGQFSEEVKYFMEKTESIIKTQRYANPSKFKIHFMIMNPENKENVIYSNLDGKVILNLFQY